jgi:hypothetical protein
MTCRSRYMSGTGISASFRGGPYEIGDLDAEDLTLGVGQIK